MPLLDTWGFFRPRHPFWVDSPASQCTPLGRAGVTEAQPPFRGCPSPAPSSAAPGLSRQHCSGRLDPTATGKDTSSPPLSPEVDVSSPEGAVRAERAWRLSPWTEASPVPGLERGGDEAVCGELRHLEGGDDSVSAPQAPGLLLGPHRPVRSAVLTVPGASPGPSKAGVLEPVCKTTSLSEDAYKHGVSPLLAFYILGSTRSFDWKVETKRIQQLLKLSGDRADPVCHRRGH